MRNLKSLCVFAQGEISGRWYSFSNAGSDVIARIPASGVWQRFWILTVYKEQLIPIVTHRHGTGAFQKQRDKGA